MGTVASQQGRFELGAVWQCLYPYYSGVRERLKESSINYMSNVMILEKSVHEYFGPFEISLEPLPEADKYRFFHTYSANRKPFFSALLPPDGIITLIPHDPRYLPPDRTLFETHYLVARILHTAGRGGVIEGILRCYDEIGTITADETTDICQLFSVTSLGPLLHTKCDLSRIG